MKIKEMHVQIKNIYTDDDMSRWGENCDVIQICKQETIVQIDIFWSVKLEVSTQEIDGEKRSLKKKVFSWMFLQRLSRFHEFSVGVFPQGFGKKFAKGFPGNSANRKWEIYCAIVDVQCLYIIHT